VSISTDENETEDEMTNTDEQWKEFVAMHRRGELSSEDLFTISKELAAEDEEQEWERIQYAKRSATRISGEYYLMLDQGWNHIYAKWSDDYREKVKDFIRQIKPYFEGKTLIEMDGTNPDNLCAKPIKLFPGEIFFHIYPKWGDLLAVIVILGPHHNGNPLEGNWL